MYKKIYIQRTRDISIWVWYDARWSSRRRINKLKQKSREREGKPGDEFCAICDRAIRRVAKKKTTGNATVDLLIYFYLIQNFKTRVEEDIYPLRWIDHLRRRLLFGFSSRLLSGFAKRVALYTSLSIKHDVRICQSVRMPHVPILDERILLRLEEAFKPSKTDARWRLKFVRLGFLIAVLRTECVRVDLSNEDKPTSSL